MRKESAVSSVGRELNKTYVGNVLVVNDVEYVIGQDLKIKPQSQFVVPSLINEQGWEEIARLFRL